MTKRRPRRQAKVPPKNSAAPRNTAWPAAAPSEKEPFRWDMRDLLVGVGLIALILVVYAPVRHYGFVDLDDPQYVSENPFIANGLTWEGVKWAFTSVYASYWLPVIWLSHMLDVQLFGLNAGAHHVTNVVLHAVDSVLLFLVLRRATGAQGRSAFVAGLFALHPLHVESVVWITERKDVLSTFFLLLTFWAYVEYARTSRRSRYFFALALFVVGLMTKAMLVTLPFMLLLLDIWPLRRIELDEWPLSAERRATLRSLVWEKVPFLALALAAAVATYLTQRLTGAVSDTTQIPVTLRLGNAMVSYATYVVKMLWPTKLALFYPYPLSLSPVTVAVSVLGLVAVTVLALRSWRRYPYLAVGWFWYLGSLVPVIGFIQAGDQARADRFTYVPLIGVFIMVAWGVYDLVRRTNVLVMAGVSALAAVAIVARIQVQYWQTNTGLWEHALRVADESYVAHTNLGLALFAQGKIDQSIPEFRAALRIRPDFAEAYNDLGVALANQRDLDGAIQAFLNAIKAKPKQAPSHYNVAVLLARRGDTTAAIGHLQDALALVPDYADARRELQRLGGGNRPP